VTVPATALGAGRGLGDGGGEDRRPGPVLAVPAVATTTPTADGDGDLAGLATVGAGDGCAEAAAVGAGVNRLSCGASDGATWPRLPVELAPQPARSATTATASGSLTLFRRSPPFHRSALPGKASGQ
jgi:hypothetical protein